MDQPFTAEQWKQAEALALHAIADASGSARVVTEMLRIWDETQALREKQQARGE